ncbi:hypothetical protein [Spirillospora sp. NPDC047279]|uniref:hypothetical protein n=1 Tax=Spirillospora sp. NPDC047279 TaxID=3155478 RepID=UPI0033FE9383
MDGTVAAGIPWQGREFVDNQFHTHEPEEPVRLALSSRRGLHPQRRLLRLGGGEVQLAPGGTTMTASLTMGDAALDFAATAEIFGRAKQALVDEVFCRPAG